jgi:hypothetical protein
MLNLTSKKTLDAKMRVKSDIFAGWEEDIDHQVRGEEGDGGGAGLTWLRVSQCRYAFWGMGGREAVFVLSSVPVGGGCAGSGDVHALHRGREEGRGRVHQPR